MLISGYFTFILSVTVWLIFEDNCAENVSAILSS